jgi:hypothetical protein
MAGTIRQSVVFIDKASVSFHAMQSWLICFACLSTAESDQASGCMMVKHPDQQASF